MEKNAKRIRIFVLLSMSCLVFAIIYFGTSAHSERINNVEQVKLNVQTPLNIPRILLLRLFIHDWNWWDNYPHMFSIPVGNIGVGTTDPHAKLDIFGNIAIHGKEIINESGVWVGDPSGLQGPQGPPGDSQWCMNGSDIYYTNGSVGIGTPSPSAVLQIDNGAVVFTGELGSTPVSGTGTRLVWIPSKASFRAGSTYGNLWDEENIGSHSIAMGFSTKASEYGSTALGAYTTASGILSTAMGEYTTAAGYGSTALGVESIADGFASVATGFLTKATGQSSTAMGKESTATGNASTAFGYDTSADADYAIAMGRCMRVKGVGSVGIGLNSMYPNWIISQNNVLSVMGGNIGIGTTHPNATLEINGTIKVLGEWDDNLTFDAVYHAETDGFVSVLISIAVSGGEGYVYGYTDDANPPVNIRGSASVSAAGSGTVVRCNSFLMPIRKGDFWKVSFYENMYHFCTVDISWIPLGT